MGTTPDYITSEMQSGGRDEISLDKIWARFNRDRISLGDRCNHVLVIRIAVLTNEVVTINPGPARKLFEVRLSQIRTLNDNQICSTLFTRHRTSSPLLAAISHIFPPRFSVAHG